MDGLDSLVFCFCVLGICNFVICCHCGLGCVVREQYLLHVFLTIDHGYVSWGGAILFGDRLFLFWCGGMGWVDVVIPNCNAPSL